MDVPDEVVRSFAGLCCYSLLGFFLDFLHKNMDVDVDLAVDNLICFFHGATDYALQRRKNIEDKPLR